MKLFLGLIMPFIGTTLGSSMVFLMNEKFNKKIEYILLGLSAGIMTAASIWSLIIPSIEFAKNINTDWLFPVVFGFIIGFWLLHFINTISEKKNKTNISMVVLAITLHNIPEGMAVGVSLAGVHNGIITITSALILSLGIAIQNIPEGAIISMPLKEKGYLKRKAFIYGLLSGIVEPVAALLTLFLTKLITNIISYILSFAAGAMIYVVVKELLPDFKKSIIGILSFISGFMLMMFLDILL